ncbi:MAG: type II toxin-antitoxin system prevent-host-death family antitoxin [Rhodoferax sp.]|nr:type II toxin-antitoxin system prevent-host-death family antitoxin [Rhodoferax sp.]
MRTTPAQSPPSAWRLQDAKAQFSALVDNAMRGVPQHVTRRGKQAVVVLSEADFEALQRNASSRSKKPMGLIDHLLAMPKAPMSLKSKTQAAADAQIPSLDLQPRCATT